MLASSGDQPSTTYEGDQTTHKPSSFDNESTSNIYYEVLMPTS